MNKILEEDKTYKISERLSIQHIDNDWRVVISRGKQKNSTSVISQDEAVAMLLERYELLCILKGEEQKFFKASDIKHAADVDAMCRIIELYVPTV